MEPEQQTELYIDLARGQPSKPLLLQNRFWAEIRSSLLKVIYLSSYKLCVLWHFPAAKTQSFQCTGCGLIPGLGIPDALGLGHRKQTKIGYIAYNLCVCLCVVNSSQCHKCEETSRNTWMLGGKSSILQFYIFLYWWWGKIAFAS